MVRVWRINKFQVCKVKAHRDVSEAKSTLDAWRISGNSLADVSAKASLTCENPQVIAMSTPVHDHELEESQDFKNSTLAWPN